MSIRDFSKVRIDAGLWFTHVPAKPPEDGREALIDVLRGIMLGDFGHDLPDQDFWTDADAIIARLEDAGFEIIRKEVC